MVRKRVPLKDKTTPTGKVLGRPLEWTDELIEAEAAELIRWAQLDNSTMLTRFCADRWLFEEDISRWSENNKIFAQALKYAKMQIAARREDMVNKEQINYGVYHRYQGMYDPLMHKHERAEKAYDAELKRQIVAGATGNINLNITDYSKA